MPSCLQSVDWFLDQKFSNVPQPTMLEFLLAQGGIVLNWESDPVIVRCSYRLFMAARPVY